MGKREDFLERVSEPWFLAEIVDKTPILEGSIKANDKVEFRCPKGHPNFFQRVNDHYYGGSGSGCPVCRAEGRREYFRGKAKEGFSKEFMDSMVDPSKALTGELKAHDVVEFKCEKHGIFRQRVCNHKESLSRGRNGCPKCGRIAKIPVYREVGFPEWVFQDSVGTYDKKNIRSGDFIEFVCKDHGPYKQTLSHRLEGRGCPVCDAQRRRKLQAETKRERNPYTPEFLADVVYLDELVGAKVSDKITFKCHNGHPDYKQSILNHMKGQGCPLCNRFRSKAEIELFELLSKYFEVKTSDRSVIRKDTGRGYELDLYIPERKFAIEFNGLFWHSVENLESSDVYNLSSRKMAEEYHWIKSNLCEEKGIQLIHIFEDDWNEKKEIVLNLVMSKLGLLKRRKVGARNTIVCEVSTEEAREFYDANHIQGFGVGICYGLYYEGRLLSAMSVQRAPSNVVDAGSHILNRYASVPDVFVMGGFEKLLHYVEKQLQITRWVSYADRTISNGALYIKQGFTEVGRSAPDYKYIVNGRRVHKFNYRIQRFKTDPNLLYEEGLSEKQLAELNGIPRIYDCGKIKYVKEVKGEHR